MTAAIALVAAGVGGLWWRHCRGQRRIALARSHFFDDCLPLLEDAQVSQSGIEFPRLVGRRQGWEVQLTPVVDTLSVRKLPSLWILVTVVAPVSVPARFDLMMRPNGAEAFSNFHRLEHTVVMPADWPAGLVIRTDQVSALPLGQLGPHLGFFQDPRAKEMLITSSGVRLVWQTAEAARAEYGVYRQARFEGVECFDAELARRLIDGAFAIREEFARAGTPAPVPGTETPA